MPSIRMAYSRRDDMSRPKLMRVRRSRRLMNSHSEAWLLVKDLHQPRPGIFWIDFLLSTLAGWAGFALLVFSKPFSASMWLGFLVGTFALYRGLCFVHEI